MHSHEKIAGQWKSTPKQVLRAFAAGPWGHMRPTSSQGAPRSGRAEDVERRNPWDEVAHVPLFVSLIELPSSAMDE